MENKNIHELRIHGIRARTATIKGSEINLLDVAFYAKKLSVLAPGPYYENLEGWHFPIFNIEEVTNQFYPFCRKPKRIYINCAETIKEFVPNAYKILDGHSELWNNFTLEYLGCDDLILHIGNKYRNKEKFYLVDLSAVDCVRIMP